MSTAPVYLRVSGNRRLDIRNGVRPGLPIGQSIRHANNVLLRLLIGLHDERGLGGRVLMGTRPPVSGYSSESEGISTRCFYAFEVRKIAVETIQADARDLRLTVDALGQELKNVKASITQLGQNPLNFAVRKFMIPAALSVRRDLMAYWGDALKASFATYR